MNRKMLWLLWIVALAILISGAYRYWNTMIDIPSPPNEQLESPGKGVVGNVRKDTDAYDVLVTFDDSGFTPEQTTIVQGKRVRFLNASNEESWPASGIHPTHSLYPEKEKTDCLGSSFDACTGLKKDEFFDFTFNYAGEWQFHDHLHPSKIGTITVEKQP